MPPQTPQQQPIPFRQKIEIARRLAFYPALSIILFFRFDVGYRVVSPFPLFILASFIVCVAWRFREIPRSQDLVVFAVLMFCSGIRQRLKQWKAICNNVAEHSGFIGSSPFQRIKLPRWLLRERRAGRWCDVIACAAIGYALTFVSPLLGWWVLLSTACLRWIEKYLYTKDLDMRLDTLDGIMASSRQSDIVQTFTAPLQSEEKKTGSIPTGLADDIEEKIHRPNVTHLPPSISVSPQQPKQKPNKKMNSTNHISSLTVKGIKNLIEEMEPLAERKSPVMGAVAGLFGAIGIALYFQKKLDFTLSFAICIIILIIGAPTGEAIAILAPIICAFYGYHRAKSSNAKLGARGGKHVRVMEAEVVVQPVPAPPTIPQAQTSATATLRALDHMLGERLITYAEYEEKRREVLARL